MPEYKEYALQGGQPVRIQPFDAAEAGEGVHFAEEGCAFNPVIVTGGGGNPNYVETIEGTLNEPIPFERYNEVYNELKDGDATVIVSGTINGFGKYNLYAVATSTSISAVNATIIDDFLLSVLVYFPHDSTEVPELWAYQTSIPTLETTNISELISADDPITTTIIHHPLPDSGT